MMATQNILSCLEMTFGKTPKIVCENLKYMSYRDENNAFVCNTCDKVIQIVNDNVDMTTSNFEKHFRSVAHKKFAVTEKELLNHLNATFKGNIPQIVRNNIEILGVDGPDYECSICDKIIKVTGYLTTTENNFSYHLVSAGHDEELDKYRDDLGQLHDIYGGIPQVVLNHKQFLMKNGKDYILCKLCDKHIQVHPRIIDETEKSFEKHLHSLDHMRNAKQEHAFSLFPELRNIFNHLPGYMLRSIEYISVNGCNYFCTLCNENIKVNHNNRYETELNFKLHNLSEIHQEKLSNRRELNSGAFQVMQNHYEELPALVMDNLRWLSVNGDDYYCRVCRYDIYDDENVSDNLSSHFESNYHMENVDTELERQSEVIDELEDHFGCVPQQIEENIKHIEFTGKNDFNCLLCDKTMKSKTNGEDYETDTSITEENFTKHLDSNKHCEELDCWKEENDSMMTGLGDLFFPIPQFIMNNLNHLGCNEDDDDFFCYLCDKTIQIVNGNKKGELTEQNFRVHILSAGHLANLKQEANQIMTATDELQGIFNKVPSFVLCNIEYIEIKENAFHCTLCDVLIPMVGNSSVLEKQFRQHLLGKNHKTKLEEEENDIDEAFNMVDNSFHCIPEFILSNIDFLNTAGDDLYCTLCQLNLPIDEDDLTETSKDLRDHFESNSHRLCLKSL